MHVFDRLKRHPRSLQGKLRKDHGYDRYRNAASHGTHAHNMRFLATYHRAQSVL